MRPILPFSPFSGQKRFSIVIYAFLLSISAAIMILFASPSSAANQKEEPQMADTKTESSTKAEGSKSVVSHRAYASLLKRYVHVGEKGEPSRVDYAALAASTKDRAALESYVMKLSQSTPSTLTKDAQFAFWANLYNALTIKVVLDYYPVSSIRKINISPGLFAKGPWGKKLIDVEGKDLSLDDIEHKILRPQWKDPRIHYALNCASYGCPSLPAKPFTATALEAQLNAAARGFINSPRGARIENDRLIVSKIYDWYEQDFVRDDTLSSDANVISHLRLYADKELAATLKGRTKINSYEYIWTLNDVIQKTD